MMIEFTPEEQQRIEEIHDTYAPELNRLRKALERATDEDRREMLVRQQTVLERKRADLDAYLDEVQRSRFAIIAKGGADAIIANAKEQAGPLLEDIYNITEREYKGATSKALKEMGIGTVKAGKLLLSANYAAQALRDELRLHIDALRGDNEHFNTLIEVIIETVEVSTLADSSDITDQQQTGMKRFRRNPLTDIAYFGIMNDKASASLLQDPMDVFKQKPDGQFALRWAVNQAPEKATPVMTYMALSYEGAEGNITKKLTAFDKRVYEAISTRFYYWQQDNQQRPLYITPQEIWRTMNGKSSRDGKAKPGEAQVNRICESLDKMRFTRFIMDITAEIEAYKLSIDDERITNGRIETYLLNSSKVIFTTEKGNTVSGYRIGEEPILYTYNKVKNHLLYVPYEMLDTSDFTSDSENVVEFKGYLLQQIQLMKNAEEGKKGKRFKRNNVILLETLYRDTGILPPEDRTEGKAYQNDTIRQREVRRFRQADRQKVEGILAAWVAKGWIKGYVALNQNNEPLKEKQQAKGYRIDL